MFSQMTIKNLQVSNQSSNQLLRDSLDKFRYQNQKLMVFQVLTSKKSLLCEISPQANLLSKKALGVDVNTLVVHPNSNLRAFSYILIQAFSQVHTSLQTGKQVEDKMIKFKQNPPLIKNYLLCQKFKPIQILQIFSAMQYKIAQLSQSGLSIYQILKVYSGYLQLTSIFLRCILSMVNLKDAEDCCKKLSTNQIFSILSQYLDLSYIVNKNIYLFPDLKIFIATPDDKQFIFGRYYENSQDLKNNQNQIRQSTMNYLNQQNQRYTDMKVSNMNLNLDITMSQFMYSERATDIIPFSSKAPTPQFGEKQYNGFQEIMFNNFGESMNKQGNPNKYQQEKQTTPGSNINFDMLQNTLDINKQRQLMKQSAFVKKGFEFDDQEVMTPVSNNFQSNKNGFGSGFYLHQFDFFRNAHQNQSLAMQQMRSQRVLMKGSSMVQQGKIFMKQVGSLKKEIQNQIMGRQRDRIFANNSTLQQSESARNLGSSFQKNSRKISPFNQNVKSEKAYDNKSKSSNSNISHKNSKKMELSSEVYQIIIGNQVNPKPRNNKIKSPTQSLSKSTSQNKPAYSPKQLLANKPKFNSPKPITLYPGIKLAKPKRIQKLIPSRKYTINSRQSQIPQKNQYNHSDSLLNNKHNHIHIHIHNQNNQKSRSKSKSPQTKTIKIQKPRSRQVNIQYICNINDKKQLKHAFENAIPEIIRHIQNQKIQTNYNSKQKDIKNLNQSAANYNTNYGNYSFYANNKLQGQHLKSKSDKTIYPYIKYSPVQSLNYNSSNEMRQSQQQLKLRKRKSQNGLQVINQTKIKEQKSESYMVPNKKTSFHIPSFLRKKQKLVVQNTNNNMNSTFSRYVEKSHNQHISSNQQSEAHISTQPSIKQKQRIGGKQYRKNQQKIANINMKGKMTMHRQIQLQTPALGTPQQHSGKAKK